MGCHVSTEVMHLFARPLFHVFRSDVNKSVTFSSIQYVHVTWQYQVHSSLKYISNDVWANRLHPQYLWYYSTSIATVRYQHTAEVLIAHQRIPWVTIVLAWAAPRYVLWSHFDGLSSAQIMWHEANNSCLLLTNCSKWSLLGPSQVGVSNRRCQATELKRTTAHPPAQNLGEASATSNKKSS